MLKLTTAILCTGFLAGCATVPDVTFTYYGAKWNAVATVTQTVGCSPDKTSLAYLNTPLLTTTYSSDLGKPYRIKIKELEGPLADSAMTMYFTDDGRLKSINQNTTGQGEAIVKSAVALAAAVAVVAFQPIAECDTIEKWGAGKPVTINYRNSINSATLGQDVALEATKDSEDLYKELRNGLPKLSVKAVKVSQGPNSQSGASYTGSSDDVVLLELQKMGFVDITFSEKDAAISTIRIAIPEDGTYKLPIPKAAVFGKQTFVVTLSEASAVTSVGYGKDVGMAGALNAFGAIINTQTPAAQADDLRAQADLIVQQQRLVLCQTNRAECK